MTPATCHPERRPYAKGFCRRCYEKQLRMRNPEFAERQRENCRRWTAAHPTLKREGDKAYRSKQTKEQRRARSLRRQYKLTQSDVDKMIDAQGGACAMCRRPFSVVRPCIDHDHDSGSVRGVLCTPCNTGLGVVENLEFRDAALAYLAEHTGTGLKSDNEKEERFDLLPPFALRQVARVYGFGARKYAPQNWRKGMAWMRLYAAIQRHTTAWASGEDIDPESGLPHLAHAAFSCLALIEFATTGAGTDDRP